MADNQNREYNEQRKARQTQPSGHEREGSLAHFSAVTPPYPGSLLADNTLSERGNTPVRIAIVQQMQRDYGNRAVQRFLRQPNTGLDKLPTRAVNRDVQRFLQRTASVQRCSCGHEEEVHELAQPVVQREVAKSELPPDEEEIPSDNDAKAEAGAGSASHSESASTASSSSPSTTHPWQAWGDPSEPITQGGVTTVLRRGDSPQTYLGAASPDDGFDAPKNSAVAPGGAPTLSNTANDCTPSTSRAVLAWDPVSIDATNWGVSVTSLTLAGVVNIKPWPSQPASMVVPNTANPVDGGNINNTAGSSNQWQAAIDDMADYHAPGGGAGPNWHSTAASSAHEWTHWNTDYVVDSVSSAAGGNWSQTNTDLDALREPKASSPDAAAARTALQPKVDTRMRQWRNATINRWNAIPDTPGTPGSRGYDAGKAVLDTHIAAIRTFATAKGWTGTPTPPPTPTPGTTPATGGSGGDTTSAPADAGSGALTGAP